MGDGIPDFLQPPNEQTTNIPTVPQQLFEFKDEPDSDPPPKKPSAMIVVPASAVAGAILYSLLTFGARNDRADAFPLEISIFLGVAMGVIFSPAVIHFVHHDAMAKRSAIRNGQKQPVVSQTVAFSISLFLACIVFTSIVGKSPGMLEGAVLGPVSFILVPKVQSLLGAIVKRR